MIVMKFGGISIGDAPSIERVVEIVSSRLDRKPVLVFSAMSKTTRNLLTAAKLSVEGKIREAEENLGEIRRYHFEVAQILIPMFEKSDAQARLEEYFRELQEELGSVSQCGELIPCNQDKVLSYGELMATAIMASVLQEHGVDAALLDARNFIITDDHFTQARPVEEKMNQCIREVLQPVLASNRIPIVQGFIGSTCDGKTTTLGFEGSDYTATLIGAALHAEDIQIWKDVSGVLTADPSVVHETRTVQILTYEEAAELSFYGAKVLHPCTIEPVRRRKIPIHICNSRQPKDKGTLIVSSTTQSSNPVKSITYTQPLDILRVQAHSETPPYDFLKTVYSVLDREGIVALGMRAEETTVSLAIKSSEITKNVIEYLEQIGEVSIAKGKASVSLVGENLRSRHDFASTVFQNLNGVPIDMVSETVSPINFTFVVDESDVLSVVARLHGFFF